MEGTDWTNEIPHEGGPSGARGTTRVNDGKSSKRLSLGATLPGLIELSRNRVFFNKPAYELKERSWNAANL